MQRLRALLTHAAAEVPYYREILNSHSVSPDSFTLEDLASLPILEKAAIQSERSRMVTEGIDIAGPGIIENHTGGSTGEPLTLYQDRHYHVHSMAELRRDFYMCGYKPGDRQVFLWGSDYDATAHKSTVGKVKDYIQNLVWVNTFDLTVASLLEAHQRMLSFRPSLVVGYVSSVTLLASLLRERSIDAVRPRAIQTSAEVLSDDQRVLIETTFGCRVFDRYGCREVGNIAHECEAHEGLHVLAENNIVEIVREDGTTAEPGETGYVVVTNLLNKTMPLIRYRVGDLAVLGRGACGCGRGLPMITDIVGRSTDVVSAPNGKLLHGEFFTHLFYKLGTVRQFRVTQKTKEELFIEMVPGPGFNKEACRWLTCLIHDQADPSFRVAFDIKERIPASGSGKFRFTVSQVPLSLTGGSDRDE